MATMMKTPAQLTEAEIGSRFANGLLFSGIALVILGIIAIAAAVLFTIGTVVLFGVLLVASAIFEFIHAFRAKGVKNVAVTVLSGILYLVAGAILISSPVAGALGLTLVIAAFLLVAGILRIAYSIQHRRDIQWGWCLVAGVIDLALAFLIARHWPATGLWVIGAFVGIEMLLNGIADIAMSVPLRQIAMTSGAYRDK